jgi:glycosyltransferase involved in cell wall biosynthesis
MSDPRNHLSYRIGNTLINSFKNPLKLFILPYLILKDYLNFKKYLLNALNQSNKSNKHIPFNKFLKSGFDIDLNVLNYLNKEFIRNNLDTIVINKKLNNIYEYFSRNENTKNTQSGPLVSVIMGAYNSEQSIGSSIHSILNQTYRNLELIIIDDASTDNTQEIIKKFILKDKRVKLIINKINVGTYISRNYALKYLTGDFITTQDADDWSHPQRIETQLKILQNNPQILLCYGKAIKFEKENILKILNDKNSYDSFVTIFFRRNILEKLGSWDNVRISADSEFLKRFYYLYGNLAIANLNHPLLLMFSHQNNLTNDMTTKVGFKLQGDRLKYMNNSKIFLSTLTDENELNYEFPLSRRRFSAPNKIIVQSANIYRNLN